MLQYHAFFVRTSIEILLITYMTNLTERELKYVDLIVPLIACPFGKTTQYCPFIDYWKSYEFEERIFLIHSLSDIELKQLQAYHRNCMTQRISGQGRGLHPLR